MYIGKYTSINENSKKTRERRGKQTVTIFSKPTSGRVKFVTYFMCTRVPPLILLSFRSRYDSELLWWAYTVVVCLSVCLSVRSYFSRTTRPRFSRTSGACYLWSWLGPPLAALRYSCVLPVLWMTPCLPGRNDTSRSQSEVGDCHVLFNAVVIATVFISRVLQSL